MFEVRYHSMSYNTSVRVTIPQYELQYLRQVISSLALLPDLYIADYTLGHCSGLLYSDPEMTRYDMDNNTL